MFIRVVTLCFVTLVLTACVTGEKFSKISQGMSRADVIDRLGSPDGVQTQGTAELLTYANRFMSDWSWIKPTIKCYLIMALSSNMVPPIFITIQERGKE
ncbi:Uncharacterised protein [Raoultella ornithinolytica]|nr:Uncharacterised protein [Raoultella ornithinolytica]